MHTLQTQPAWQLPQLPWQTQKHKTYNLVFAMLNFSEQGPVKAVTVKLKASHAE